MMIAHRKLVIYSSLAMVAILTVGLYISVIHQLSDDMRYFLIPWYEHLEQYGFHGISSIGSNYNVPYLYLLWLSSKLPFEAVVSIKLITILFGIIFSLLVYVIVKERYHKPAVPIIAAISALFIPTIFLQAAIWGQCDIIYTTFLVASWWRLTKNEQISAWLLFGIALAFKLQAIFFLPYLGYTWFSRNRIVRPYISRVNISLLFPVLAPIVIILMAVPAILIGMPGSSIINVYAGQVSDPGNTVSLGNTVSALGLFVDMHDKSVLYLARPAVYMTVILIIAILALYTLYAKKTKENDFYLLPLLLLTLIPFFLPFMRERYFFAAEVFSLLFAVLTRRKIFILSAIVLQATVLPAYAQYLWHHDVWPGQYLAALQLSIIITMTYILLRPESRGERIRRKILE